MIQKNEFYNLTYLLQITFIIVEDRIEYLLRQYEKNNCSREELEELFSYINNLRTNDMPLKKVVRNIYDDIRKNHPSFTYVDEDGKLILNEPEESLLISDKSVVSGKAKRKLLIVVAASCIVGLLSLTWLIKMNLSNDGYLVHPISGVLTKKFANKAEQKFFTLSDSTQIWLNAASSLEFPDHFSDDEREVILEGEALFKVDQSKQSSFIIYVGKIIITVPPGTTLNTKAYANEQNVVIAVSEGKVILSHNGKRLPTVAKGRALFVNKTDGSVDEKKVAVENIAAWQKGNMIYEKVRLIDVLGDFKRVYNVDIVLSKPELENVEISTAFRRDIGIKEALDIICNLTNSQLDGENEKFIIL
ncbi:MAG: FecR domain-containing protein [Agriterribacter sp.]